MNELHLFAGEMVEMSHHYWKTTEYKREKARAWRLANIDRVKAYRQLNRRKHYLQESARKYGVTQQWFETQMALQGQACAVCRLMFAWDDKQTKPHIDHCHASGKLRGILCNRCNTILGLVQDSQPRLLALTEYLRCHG